ncbi:hypothetical protein [Kumtagia ephedrae]|uniref:Uncharacterized protein n=1 Tax=Kumtagia ephedrae TaxID=2116701 RepID=A0A2P7S5I7_9HYPH|nr:hypothetical protein [Mesorhizobium ephedrae]PSJ57699.1 hypothetical protein C7I84_16835 [Mesorhizobium ephedrae]
MPPDAAVHEPHVSDPMPSWLPVLLIGMVVALVVGLGGYLFLQAGLHRSAPTLEQATRTGAAAVGQAVAGQFAHALALGIPLAELPGVEPYLRRIAENSPQVEGMALLDADGRTISSTMQGTEGTRFPISAGGTRATLVVAPETPLIDRAMRRVWIALAATALLAGAVAGGLVAFVTRLHQEPAQRRFLADMRGIADGIFAVQPSGVYRGPLADAARALAQCVEGVRAARRNLVEAAATIRAIDFDGSLGRRVDVILQPIDRRYAFPETDDDASARTQGSSVAWRLALLFGLYAAAFPYVANFAIDREPEGIAAAWAPVLPLLAELAAACLGALAGATRAGRNGGALLAFALLFGVCVGATYWCRDYGVFIALRCGAGLSAGFVAAALLCRYRLDIRPRELATLLIFAALFAAPLLAGLYGEAIGRRSGFLLLGIVTVVAAPFIAVGMGASENGATARAASRFGRGDVLLGMAVLPAAAMILVELPIGVGFDDYLSGGGAIALLAAAALAAPALSPLACAAAMLAAAAVLHLPVPYPGVSVFAACALLGLAAGGMFKQIVDAANRPWIAIAVGVAGGLALIGALRHAELPFAYLAAAAALVVIAVNLAGRHRPATAGAA